MTVAEGVDRRRYARQRIASLTYIELGTDNGGIVVNLGEGGLAFAAASPLHENAISELRFRLPGSAAWIRASAEITWIGESRKEAGVSFVELTEADRTSIREWLSGAELVPPAAPASRAFGRSQTGLPAPRPEFDSEFESEFETEPPSDRVGTAGETVDMDRSPRLPAAAPPAMPLTTEVPAEIPKETAKEPVIRIELRVKRRSVTAILVSLAALLAFFAGMLAGQRSWTDRLRNVLRQAFATPSSGHLQSTTQANPPTPDSSGSDLPQPGAPVPSPAGASASSRNENEVTSPPGAATAPTERPLVAQPTEPPPAQPLDQPPADQAPAQQGTQAGNQAAAPVAVPPVAPATETPSPAPAAAPSANPDVAVASPPIAAPIPTGAVEVIADPYPSIRIPPNQPNSPARMPLQLGQLITPIEPIYPQQALREGVQGVVQLHLLIAADGTLMDVQVVRGPQALVQSVRDAVGRWRYQPTYLGGQAVGTEADVTITFRLITPPAAAPAK